MEYRVIYLRREKVPGFQYHRFTGEGMRLGGCGRCVGAEEGKVKGKDGAKDVDRMGMKVRTPKEKKA